MKVSIVTPTYNEKDNIEKLVTGIFNDCHEYDVEIIIVDDNSPDGTGKIADELSKKYNLKVVHRAGKLGLSSAVIAGWQAAEGEILGVIDADLSHPSSKIPELLDSIIKDNVDIAIASRLIPGGGVEEWPFIRRFISWGATMLARPLTKVRDPMTGFFFFRKKVIDNVELKPVGYKILLEILVKGNCKTYKELPYIFLNRSVGSSKLDLNEHINYIKLLARLYKYKFL